MKKLLVTLAAVLVTVSSFAQGSVIFNNRTQAGDRPITLADTGAGAGTLPGATAQLFLVTGGTGAEAIYTPLTPTTPFRTGAAARFFTEINPFIVDGVLPGQSARLQVRAWVGGSSYETATQYRGASPEFTIAQLGGTPAGGAPIPPPSINGLQEFQLQIVPEPSTIALGVLGAAALLYRRRK